MSNNCALTPDDWSPVTMSEVCQIEIGGTPSRNNLKFWAEPPSGYPWVAISDLTTKVITETSETITRLGVQNSNTSLVSEGTLLMSFKLTLGKVAIAGVDLYTNEAIAAFFPKDDSLLTQWLYHALPNIARTASIDQAVKGQTLNKKKLEKLRFYLPATAEQRSIAHILDTIDEAIATTTAHIDKLKLAKAGLLHDLLTRGIDDNGKLRDPTRHPEQFKDSELGLIPKDWELNTLGKIVERSNGFIQTGPFGSQLHAHEYVDSGVPVIMPQDMRDEKISTDQIGYITPEKAQSLSRHIVQLNDIIFARRGDLNRCVAIGKREENWFCGTGCMLTRISDREINGFWLAAMYRHYLGQKQILARAVGSTMVNLNSTLLNSLLIAKPEIPEQTAVVERIALHDQKILSKVKRLEKLRLLKQGLMSDLLTGRVRVQVDVAEAD